MGTIGRSEPTQQRENDRFIAQLNLLSEKITKLEKSSGILEKNSSLLEKKVVDLQLAVELLEKK